MDLHYGIIAKKYGEIDMGTERKVSAICISSSISKLVECKP